MTRECVLQGPTISHVYSLDSCAAENGSAVAQTAFYSATICVPKKRLYKSVKELRQVRQNFTSSNSQS